jgi:hypothetical protein
MIAAIAMIVLSVGAVLEIALAAAIRSRRRRTATPPPVARVQTELSGAAAGSRAANVSGS